MRQKVDRESLIANLLNTTRRPWSHRKLISSRLDKTYSFPGRSDRSLGTFAQAYWARQYWIPTNVVQFSSVQDGIYALGNAQMRSTQSLRRFHSIAFETVPMFVWLTMALSRPFKEYRLPLPLSTPLFSRRSMAWCPWLCTRKLCLKLLSTSDLPRSKPLVRVGNLKCCFTSTETVGIEGREPRTATSTFTQLLSSVLWGLPCPPVYLLGLKGLSGKSRAVHAQEVSKVDVKYRSRSCVRGSPGRTTILLTSSFCHASQLILICFQNCVKGSLLQT